MKLRSKLLWAVSVMALLIGLSSCTHEYTCQCRISYSGQPGLPDTMLNEYTIRDTKSQAKSICENNSMTSEQNGIKTVEDCKIW
jgi:hypothetical protein